MIFKNLWEAEFISTVDMTNSSIKTRERHRNIVF